MGYRCTAYSVGWLAIRILSEKETTALVRLLFDNTIYLDFIDDMVIVTRKQYSSPVTVNLYPDECWKPFNKILRIGEKVFIEGNMLRINGLTINIDKAGIFNSRSLTDPSLESLNGLSKILDKLLRMLSLLYSTANVNIPIFKTLEFKKFMDEVVCPFAGGDTGALHNPEKYRILLGAGEGFTPSGDDFISGFISVINFFHKLLSIRKVRLDEKILFDSTTWASAMYIKYMQLGIYDGVIEDFFSAISNNEPGEVVDALISIVRRGHTSGLDISLGLTVGLASVISYLTGRESASNIVKYMENFY